jgi:UDP:flavonoid glycosyltransferase YjiC (YdhE family)
MPHAKLFPRVAAVVHHGGAGTTAAALRAGACQVIVPHFFDQYYYAHRLRELGIAPAGIPVRRLTARRLQRAIDAALALPPDARLQAAERLREGSGIARAVEMLESMLTA